ncbi:MAG: hypothetical protein EAZ27_03140 [Cytophagales bacterium]|nr:MAG: hypothetical protein EAZ27_03140 [Cytophagales bacterium]
MKKIILTGSMVLVSILTYSQDLPNSNKSQEIITSLEKESDNKQDEGKKEFKKVKKTPEERANFLTENVKTACGDISAEQETKIRAIFLERAQKVDAIKSSSQANKKEALKPLFQKSKQDLKAILTEAQFEKFKTYRKNRKENRNKNSNKEDSNVDDDKDDNDDNELKNDDNSDKNKNNKNGNKGNGNKKKK